MENIIKGLEILKVYNGKLIARNNFIRVFEFEYKTFLKDDKNKLIDLNWIVICDNLNELVSSVVYEL